jgi:hypothetical protein
MHLIDQANIGLMDQRRCFERLAGILAGQLSSRQASQFVIDEGSKTSAACGSLALIAERMRVTSDMRRSNNEGGATDEPSNTLPTGRSNVERRKLSWPTGAHRRKRSISKASANGSLMRFPLGD